MDIYIAALLNQPSITEQLIVARCNIDLHREDGATPLIIAAANGYDSVTKQLLEARCNVDLQVQDGESALYNAAKNGHAGVTKQLIEARCNFDAQKKYFCTKAPMTNGGELKHFPLS